MSWLVCAYYTKNTIYEKYVENLISSLRKFNLSYDITSVDDLGNWYKNTQYKPVFLKKMLRKYHPYSVVYVDIDATFCEYPILFDKLDKVSNFSIAAHVLNHSRYRRKSCLPELLSGTIFLKNTERTSIIINEWISECEKDPMLWDQRALVRVLGKGDLCILPEQYCVIFDYMSGVVNPVIKHFQASRGSRLKNQSSKVQNRVIAQPRKVVRDGVIVRVKRANIY